MAKVHDPFDERCTTFYLHVMDTLREAKVPFLVGGAFAMKHWAGIARWTKDLDLFIRPIDVDRAFDAATHAGYRTELLERHWLGKVLYEDLFVDLIWSSGNGIGTVDDEWFARAPEVSVLGTIAALVPAEEMIWQKAYIMERERFDGADVLHILREQADRLDWGRLARRFGDHWRVLFAHLVLFGFAFPAERDRIPASVMAELARRLDGESARADPDDTITRGTLLSRYQYEDEVADGRYKDARLLPPSDLTAEDVGKCA